MKCQTCQSRAATVHFTDLSDSGLKEYHLCEECYAVQKPQGTDMIGMIASALTGVSPRSQEEAMPQTCAQCGLTYSAFRSRGRLGCPACYDTFRPALEPLLEKIHGGRTHMGKTPFEGAARDRGKERRLIALRRKLQDAVRAENYELAATLRDELNRAEAGEEPEGAETGDEAVGKATEEASGEKGGEA